MYYNMVHLDEDLFNGEVFEEDSWYRTDPEMYINLCMSYRGLGFIWNPSIAQDGTQLSWFYSEDRGYRVIQTRP